MDRHTEEFVGRSLLVWQQAYRLQVMKIKVSEVLLMRARGRKTTSRERGVVKGNVARAEEMQGNETEEE